MSKIFTKEWQKEVLSLMSRMGMEVHSNTKQKNK